MSKFIETELTLIKIKEKMTFNVFLYLPLNRKFIHLYNQNYIADEKLMENLKNFKINYICIPIEELHEFEAYLEKTNQIPPEIMNIIHICPETGEKLQEKIETKNLRRIASRERNKLSPPEHRKEIHKALEEIHKLGNNSKKIYESEATNIFNTIMDTKKTSTEKSFEAKNNIKAFAEEFLYINKNDKPSSTDKKDMFFHSKNIAANLIYKLPSGNNQKICDNLFDLIMKNDNNSSHSVYVSSLSMFFSLACGITNGKLLSAISLGGLLHDIGICSLENFSVLVEEDNLTEDERKIYMKHCTAGVQMLKDSDIEINPITESIILSHHENYDGSGFPKGLKKHQITDAVAIVSIADYFDMLTSKGIHPLIALKKIRDDNVWGAIGTIKFKPLLVKSLMNFFNLDERIKELEQSEEKLDLKA